ncbi:MAG TPA: hypothetical protein VFV93_11560 [Thermomicrobiales bacterium]|nr:hypothetical protein [Thermomicrobiales bacterium]
MIDEELVWQRREITGETVRVCENCGRPMDIALLRQAADDTTDDGGPGMRICPDCLDAMARGVDPVELDDEDDLVPVL